MADDRIRMPSGQGGLMRYMEEAKSKIELSPGAVVVLCVTIMVIIILLHQFGSRFFS